MNTITTYAPRILTVVAAATVATIIRACTRGNAPTPRVEEPVDQQPPVALAKRKAERPAPTKPAWHALVDNFANLPGSTIENERKQEAKYKIYLSAVLDTELDLETRIQLATKCLLKLKNIIISPLETDGFYESTGLHKFFGQNIQSLPKNICKFIRLSTDEAIIDPTLHYINAFLAIAEVDELRFRLHYAGNACLAGEKLRDILLEKFNYLAQDDRILEINQRLEALVKIIFGDDSEELSPTSTDDE